MSEAELLEDFPPLTCADVLACRFSSWFPTFRKVSPKATIISPLEDRFIDYLEADGVFLPEGSGPLGVSELSDDEDAANGSDNQDDMSWQIKFPELDSQIRRVIVKYDGAVFPKLNWSSPQDAAWMLPGSTVKCQSPADIYLLLKSSDFITHDLDHAFDDCVDFIPSPPSPTLEADPSPVPDSALSRSISAITLDSDSESSASSGFSDGAPQAEAGNRKTRPYDFELVLKKWFEMPRSQEWRCFVRDRELVAISQRDTNYYDFLQSPSSLNTIRSQISDFYSTEIKDKFSPSSYTFDVYLTRANDRVFLVDFNPYAPQTDSLLIPWSTIHSLPPPSSPLIQVVTDPTMSTNAPAFSHNRYPKDVVDLSSGSSIAEFANKWRTVLEEGVLGSDGESTGSVKSIPGR